jgi:hypothetical protein
MTAAIRRYRHDNSFVRLRLKHDISGAALTIVRRAGDLVDARWWDGQPPFARGWFIQGLGFSCVLKPEDVEVIER